MSPEGPARRPSGPVRRRPARTVAACLLLLCLAGVALAGPAAAGTPRASTPLAAAPTPVPFPLGVWKGTAVLSGTLTIGPAQIAWAPSPYSFTVTVTRDGAQGNWVAKGGQVFVDDGTGQATGTWRGSGALAGTAAQLDATGSSHVHADVTSGALSFPLDEDVPDHYRFAPAGGSCATVSGDVLAQVRKDENAKGWSSTIEGMFVAQKVANVTSTISTQFQSQLTALMDKANDLDGQPHPVIADVQSLIDEITAFYATAVDWSVCDGPPTDMGKHGSSRLLMVQLVGVLVLKALQQASTLTPDQVMDLAQAAGQIGAIGATAPYPDLAKEITTELSKAISSGLAYGADHDHYGCGALGYAAQAAGLAALVAKAQACLTN